MNLWIFLYICFYQARASELAKLQTDVEETRRELNDLRVMLSDLRLQQSELRQSSNDHVIVHWLKSSISEVRSEVKELATAMADQNVVSKTAPADFQRRMEGELRQIWLNIRNMTVQHTLKDSQIEELQMWQQATHDQPINILTKELKHVRRKLKCIAQKQKRCHQHGHHP